MPPSDRPYLYSAPSHYSAAQPYRGFDPKAYTRASYVQPPQRPKPPQDGPLLNFNRHPDSYVVGTLPYGLTNVPPMHPSTKKAVTVTRRVQLGLRVLQMIGALGMLVCVILIENTQDMDSYIIRAPPAIDILTTGYAIYHLMRAAKSRPAPSSASYHFFALVIDIGLIPFYIYIVMLAKTELGQSPHDKLRWTSFFNLAGTNKVILSTWLDAIVLAGMHLVESIISLFLVIAFRKIANMPPDMNPLEDNLTSRRKTKHKYKSSELSTSSISAPLTDSTVSFSKSGRASPAKDGMMTEVRPISFLHTRRNSDYVYSPHNPNTANFSRSNASLPKAANMYSQPRSELDSRMDLSKETLIAQDTSQDRTETLKSDKSMMTSSSVYTMGSGYEAKHNTPPLPRKSSKRHSFLSDNWFVHRGRGKENDEIDDAAVSVVEEDSDEPDARPVKESTSAYRLGPTKNNDGRPYQPVRQHSDFADDPRQRPPPPPKDDDGFLVAPLGMNPPTPPPNASRNAPRGTPSRNLERQVHPLATTSGNATSSPSSRPINPPSPSSSKSRYYGDLGSAMAGIRNSPGAASPSPRGTSTRPKSKHDSGFGAVVGDEWKKRDTRDGPYAGIKKQDFAPSGREEANWWHEEPTPRVVSSSGADITDERNARFYDHADEGLRADVHAAGLRGRNVSGKVAEEGRGGQWVSRWG